VKVGNRQAFTTKPAFWRVFFDLYFLGGIRLGDFHDNVFHFYSGA